MRRLVIAAVLAAIALGGADKKAKKKKTFIIEVLETSARRSEGIIAIDARVRNASERPVEHLILIFDIMAAGDQVISTQKIEVEEDVVEAGAEASIQAQMRDAVRAVSYGVRATDRAGHDMEMLKSGPYVIE